LPATKKSLHGWKIPGYLKNYNTAGRYADTSRRRGRNSTGCRPSVASSRNSNLIAMYHLSRYREVERPSRAAVLPALWRRLRMTGGDDSYVVVKHVYGATRPPGPFDAKVYRDLRREGRDLVRDHFPHEMGVRMLLKPLALGPRTQRVALPVAVALARRLVP
jgi:hypothetical protein